MKAAVNVFASRGMIALAVALTLSGCAFTSVMPVAANTYQITASAAPACGAIGAEEVASRDAAIATIRYGFDSYVIVSGQAQDNVGVVGYTPVTAYTSGSATAYGNTAYGQSTTTYSGGAPIIAGTHDQEIVVQMFHANDPGAQNAISAVATLGPNWQKIVNKGFPHTCL
jgi:hypothetical protein